MSDWFGTGLKVPWTITTLSREWIGPPFFTPQTLEHERIKVTLSQPFYEADFTSIPGLLSIYDEYPWSRTFVVNPLYDVKWVIAEMESILMHLKEK